MDELASYWLAEIHRETYVAILKSWAPHGQRSALARRAGITPEYLSYLCALDRPDGRAPTRRLPSPEVAERLAHALPAPPEVRQNLVAHMQHAHWQSAQGRSAARALLAQREIGQLLADLHRHHRQATFEPASRSQPGARRAYRVVSEISADVLAGLSPNRYPAAYAQVCLYRHDALCVLDRADEALYFGKLARLVMETAEAFEPGWTREQLDNLRINAIRAELVAYHNLGLNRAVQPLCDAAGSTRAYEQSGGFWKPLVGRDRLNSLAVTPRFGLRDARRLAAELQTICEHNADAFTLFLVRESWIRCLASHERWPEAQRLLDAERDSLPRLPYIGPLHQALLYKTSAGLAWARGDLSAWRDDMRQFWDLAWQADLRHQARSVRQRFGPALEPLLAEWRQAWGLRGVD